MWPFAVKISETHDLDEIYTSEGSTRFCT